MSAGSSTAEDALLVSQIEAARLEREPNAGIVDMLIDLARLRMEAKRFDAADAAVAELRTLIANDRELELVQLDADYMAYRIAAERGDTGEARARCERAVAVARELGFDGFASRFMADLADFQPDSQAAVTLHAAAERAEADGDFELASVCLRKLADRIPENQAQGLERALELARASGNDVAIEYALLQLGVSQVERGAYLPARRLLEQTLDAARAQDDQKVVEVALCWLTSLHNDAFAHGEAEARATALLNVTTDPDDRAFAFEARSLARHRMHDHAGARRDLLEAASIHRVRGDRKAMRSCRNRAHQDAILRLCHRLPRWLFRPLDMSSREAAAKRRSSPLLVWLVLLLLLGWTVAGISAGVYLKSAEPIVMAGGVIVVLIGVAVLVLPILRARAGRRKP